MSQYEALMNAIYDAVLITDMEGNIREVNTRATHHFNSDQDKLCGMNALDLISGARNDLLDLLRKNIKNKQFTVMEALCNRTDNTHFHAEIVVNRLPHEDQQVLCFFIRDITEKKKKAQHEIDRMHERLIEAEKTQARLDTISTLSFELNNPLQILGCLAEMDENPEYKKQLDHILRVIEQLRERGTLDTAENDDGSMRYRLPDNPEALTECDCGRLLVVDDESVLRDLFTRAIQREFPALSVDSAGNGREACDAFARNHPALIVMDVLMPVLNGEDAYQEIKRICTEKRWRKPAVIFCTGFVVSERLQKTLDEEPWHSCLKKPMAISDLVAAVQAYLSTE